MNKAALSEQDFIAIIKDDEPMSRYVEHILKEAYKYIKPHLRGEFPREAMEIVLSEMLDHIECDKKEIPEVRWASVIGNALHKCKRLWNGGTCERCGNKDCDGHGNYKTALPFACPTCKGSGEGSTVSECPDKKSCGSMFHKVPCPDCKPRGPVCLKCEYVGGSSDRFWEKSCKHRFVDQRKGDRRVHVRRGNDTVYGYREAIEFKGRRTGKDRRRGEAE